MYRFVTLTFNPCIDRSFDTALFKPDRKLPCEDLQNEPGGGGINVARAIKKLGGEALAIYPEGGIHGALLTELLKAEGVPVMPIPSREDLRENVNILERATGRQYRFIMPGPPLADEVWNRCLEEASLVRKGGYIVISGSLPEKFPPDLFMRLRRIADQRDALLVADLSRDALREALKFGVYLVKPSNGELAFLVKSFGLEGLTAAEAALEIVKRNMAQVVVVSLGGDGAVLATKGKSIFIPAPSVVKRSTVGAGDSMVAGILMGIARNMDLQDATSYGVACGTAAIMKPGTGLCNLEDADSLFAKLQRA